MDVNNLLEGAAPYQVLSEQSAKLAGKWEKSGLLEGITSSTERSNMSMLLENQAKQLVNESNSVGSAGSGASFQGGNSEAWAGVALPLVRRVFGEIVAKDLISVQPMNLPAGLIFYLDFQYGTTTGGVTAGDSIYAASADMKKTELPAQGQRSGLYGPGTYGYSMNMTSSTAGTASVGVQTVSNTSSLVNYDSELDLSGDGIDGMSYVSFLSFATTSFANTDLDTIKAWKVVGNGGAANITNLSTYNFVSGANVYLAVSGALASNASILGTGNYTIESYTTPDNLNDRGDFEDSPSGTGTSTLNIPEINKNVLVPNFRC